MMRFVLFLSLFCVLGDPGSRVRAQNNREIKFIDNTYVDNVKSVRLHVNGFPSSYPVIALGGGRLRLSFDDLSDDVRRYTYRFIHCDRDWTPSNLGALEYNPGYANDVIDDYDFSIYSLTDYVHYDLVFPNRNMQLAVSGNYLLVVTDNEGREDIPVITRRFVVVEDLGGVDVRLTRPADVSKLFSHQELDLRFGTEQLQPRNPLREISASVIQNGRWDNAVTGIPPNLIGRETIDFNYQNKIVFAGANEFRNLDLRSINAPRTPVAEILNEGGFYSMLLKPDPERANSVYLYYPDLNGDFVILANDVREESFLNNNVRFNEGDGSDFANEYLEVTFVLSGYDQPIEKDIYLFGRLTEYQMKRAFRMVWNESIGAYVGRALIKQGFHNFLYVTDEGKGKVGFEQTEDNFTDTENDYQAFVYYRPMGGRYDRVVGYSLFNSLAN